MLTHKNLDQQSIKNVMATQNKKSSVLSGHMVIESPSTAAVQHERLCMSVTLCCLTQECCSTSQRSLFSHHEGRNSAGEFRYTVAWTCQRNSTSLQIIRSHHSNLSYLRVLLCNKQREEFIFFLSWYQPGILPYLFKQVLLKWVFLLHKVLLYYK